MKKYVQIGRTGFSLSLPFAYRWAEEDFRFFQNNDPLKHVKAELVEEPLSPPARQPDFISGQIKIWQEPDSDIRLYKASFYPGQPDYAMSCRRGDHVRISLYGSVDLLMNPNLKLWNLIHLENYLLETDALVLHCCYSMYRGKAILFTAPSGTGKTTQANIWKRVYGSRIINGDKCILQRRDGTWYACGFPLHGSASECENQSYPIDTIAIVRQAKENRVEKIAPVQKVGLLYTECTVNSWDQSFVDRALNLLMDLARNVQVVTLHCNMEDDAAHTLHRAIFGGNHGTV